MLLPIYISQMHFIFCILEVIFMIFILMNFGFHTRLLLCFLRYFRRLRHFRLFPVWARDRETTLQHTDGMIHERHFQPVTIVTCDYVWY
jgi:hypothetical protein